MIPKTKTIARLKENYQAQEITLTEEEMNEIALLNRGRMVYTDPDNFSFY